jgi:protein-tyrosine phosphatase
MSLPAGSGGTYRIAMVCLGNICRSPTATVVLAAKLEQAGLTTVTVSSAGTGDWHLGGPMDPRASSTLQSAGYDGSSHRARQFSAPWYDDLDLVLTMDAVNYHDVVAMAPDAEAEQKVRMFREFDPEADADDLDVPDPWHGGLDDYARVLEIVERTTDALVEELRLSGVTG